MGLIYDFKFTSDFGGLDATVTDRAGDEVDGSPLTLDADGNGSLTLDEGTYVAAVSNAARALGNAQSVGVLNLPASIAAGGGGADGAAAWFELSANNSAIPSEDKFSIEAIDDGRAAPHPEWVEVDGADDTVLNVLMAGSYDLMLIANPRANGADVVTVPGTVQFKTAFKVNGGAEAPANYIVGWASFDLDETGSTNVRYGSTILVSQSLEVGDTLSLRAAALPLVTVDATGALWSAGDSYFSIRRTGA